MIKKALNFIFIFFVNQCLSMEKLQIQEAGSTTIINQIEETKFDPNTTYEEFKQKCKTIKPEIIKYEIVLFHLQKYLIEILKEDKTQMNTSDRKIIIVIKDEEIKIFQEKQDITIAKGDKKITISIRNNIILEFDEIIEFLKTIPIIIYNKKYIKSLFTRYQIDNEFIASLPQEHSSLFSIEDMQRINDRHKLVIKIVMNYWTEMDLYKYLNENVVIIKDKIQGLRKAFQYKEKKCTSCPTTGHECEYALKQQDIRRGIFTHCFKVFNITQEIDLFIEYKIKKLMKIVIKVFNPESAIDTFYLNQNIDFIEFINIQNPYPECKLDVSPNANQENAIEWLSPMSKFCTWFNDKLKYSWYFLELLTKLLFYLSSVLKQIREMTIKGSTLSLKKLKDSEILMGKKPDQLDFYNVKLVIRQAIFSSVNKIFFSPLIKDYQEQDVPLSNDVINNIMRKIYSMMTCFREYSQDINSMLLKDMTDKNTTYAQLTASLEKCFQDCVIKEEKKNQEKMAKKLLEQQNSLAERED